MFLGFYVSIWEIIQINIELTISPEQYRWTCNGTSEERLLEKIS